MTGADEAEEREGGGHVHVCPRCGVEWRHLSRKCAAEGEEQMCDECIFEEG